MGSVGSDYSSHNLEYLKIHDASLHGKIKMQVFDIDGTFTSLRHVDLSFNNRLNITLDFEFLSGTELDYFNILGIIHAGNADFSYLTESIVIKMNTSVVCSGNTCTSKSKNVPWTRTNDTCIGKEDCLDTCTCVTEYDAGIYKYEASLFGDYLFNVLLCVVGVALGFGIGGWGYNKNVCGRKQIWRCKKRDDFLLMSVFGYVFQLWDFFSDILLFYDIYDRWDQEPADSERKHPYVAFLLLSISFIFVPWFVNLLFLIKVKNDLYKDGDLDEKDHTVTDSLTQAKYKTRKWLNKRAPALVILCMLSGGLTASLKLVNSKLFGLPIFDMGLPKYKQDETVRHRLWLTVVLENVPQIIISTLYATTLSSFDQTVMLALVSSIASVILAVFSAFLEFPKHYYVYQMTCLMTNNSINGKIRKQLRKTNLLTFVICDSFDQDFGFCFVENVFHDGKNKFMLNVVCNEEIDFKINRKQKQNMKSNLLSSFKIEISSFDFKYISHECVDLVSFRELFFSCTCFPARNQPRLDNTIKSASKEIEILGTPSENIIENIHGDFGFAASKDINTIDNDEKERSGLHDNYNYNYDWSNWTQEKVSEWIEGILATNDFDVNEIEDFMNEFKKHKINGQVLQRFADDSSVLKDFLDVYKSQSQSLVPFGFWLAITDEIKALKLANSKVNHIDGDKISIAKHDGDELVDDEADDDRKTQHLVLESLESEAKNLNHG